MPLDLAVLLKDECRMHEQRRIEPGDAAFHAMSDAWSNALREGFTQVEL
jgi:putative proteasome-type protease